MKTLVYNETHNTRIPFLRGILIGSLQDSGMSFEDAFELATEVRTDISGRNEISSLKLRSLVEERLTQMEDKAVLEQYSLSQVAPGRITVYTRGGKESSFSRGRHERYLLSSGLNIDPAEQITETLYDQLLLIGIDRISTCELGYLTWLCLQQEAGNKAAARYLVWSEFQRSNQPLILLIGGTVGSGKSTLATEIAHQLEIVRVQSTDMLREVMRMMIPEQLMPVIHRSSFEAWKALPAKDDTDRSAEQLVAEGYRTQSELLAVPCKAVMQRALREGVSVIVEGVHAHPSLGSALDEDQDAIVVNIMLALLRSSELKSRLKSRGSEKANRQSDTYLENFESIWRLQSYLLSEADQHDVPIITNDDRDKAMREITRAVITELKSRFNGSPETVFGKVVSSKERPEWRLFVNQIAE